MRKPLELIKPCCPELKMSKVVGCQWFPQWISQQSVIEP